MAAVEKFFARAVRETDFDTVVVTGVSGLLVGPQLARAHGKNILVVRKPNDNSHSHHQLTGYQGRKLFLVDDFVSTGETVLRTLTTVNKCWPYPYRGLPNWAGVFLWAEEEREGVRTKLGRITTVLEGAPVYSCFGKVTSGGGELFDWSEYVSRVGAQGGLVAPASSYAL
jgi:hypothetical protein